MLRFQAVASGERRDNNLMKSLYKSPGVREISLPLISFRLEIIR